MNEPMNLTDVCHAIHAAFIDVPLRECEEICRTYERTSELVQSVHHGDAIPTESARFRLEALLGVVTAAAYEETKARINYYDLVVKARQKAR